MRKLRSKQPLSIDLEYMQVLHTEAIEQLELLTTTLEAAEQAHGIMRDGLDAMTAAHWNVYLDVLHMISLHDETVNTTVKNFGINMRDHNFDIREQQLSINRLLLKALLAALIRRHCRILHVYRLHGEPISDYLTQSQTLEREHMAQLITMIHSSM